MAQREEDLSDTAPVVVVCDPGPCSSGSRQALAVETGVSNHCVIGASRAELNH